MQILITGCCGFIGSHLSEELLKLNHTIIGIDNMWDNSRQRFDNKDLLIKYPNFIFVYEDVLNTKAISIYKPEIIVHLASYAGVRKSMEIPEAYVRNNIEAFVHLLDEAVKYGVKRVIYASSSSVYGNNEVPFVESMKQDPISSYACSKCCMEIYANYYYNVYKLPVIGLRFFTVYGERGRTDMAPFIFLNALHNDLPIHKFGDGASYRDYTYISDIISGIVSVVNGNGIDGEIYNLGNTNTISLNDFITLCEKITGKQAIIVNDTIKLGDVTKTYSDVAKATKDLGYVPKVPLETGLRNTYEWIKKEH
jgi:UDP-glucuronate 4-epimerase